MRLGGGLGSNQNKLPALWFAPFSHERAAWLIPHCAHPFRFINFSKNGQTTILHCEHRVTTILFWGLCKQEGWKRITLRSADHDRWKARGRLLPIDEGCRVSTFPRY